MKPQFSQMKWCKAVSDIPIDPHFAILEQRAIYIPGDERSQTNPGHGYPESTEQIWDYIVFPDRESWEAQIRKYEGAVFGKPKYVALSATPAKTTVQVTVNIE